MLANTGLAGNKRKRRQVFTWPGEGMSSADRTAGHQKTPVGQLLGHPMVVC